MNTLIAEDIVQIAYVRERQENIFQKGKYKTNKTKISKGTNYPCITNNLSYIFKRKDKLKEINCEF